MFEEREQESFVAGRFLPLSLFGMGAGMNEKLDIETTNSKTTATKYRSKKRSTLNVTKFKAF